MATIQKPDFKKSKEIIQKIKNANRDIASLYQLKIKYETEIRNIYLELQRVAAKEQLSAMDVEMLNTDKEGIRVSALKNAGIHTIAQVMERSQIQLCGISGIGETMAEKIVTNAKAIEASTAKSVSISLSPDDKNPKANALIQNLHKILKEQRTFDQSARLYEEHHNTISNCLARTSATTGNLRWLFSGKATKQAAVTSIETLDAILQTGYDTSAATLMQEHKAVAAKSAGNPWQEFSTNAAPYYALLESILGDSMGSQASHTGQGQLPEELLQSIEDFELDLSLLKANLRNYQTFGTKYILHQEKVLLGDEMGLGKTMQAIAGFCHLAATGATHFLVVCPLSVVVNWRREIEAQSELSTIEICGEGRAMEMTKWVCDGGVGITTFETLNKVPIPQTASIDMMVVDEAHYIKNPEAIRTQSVLAAGEKASRILYMSGTPLENKVEEMNFLIQCLQPEIAAKVENMKQLTQAEEYRNTIAPVYLRRVREDVLKELPELVEKEQWCLMNDAEKDAYITSLSEGNFMSVRQISWQLDDLAQSSKAQRLLEICEEMREMNRKIIVFSFFKTVLTKVADLLGDYCSGIIDGSVPASERQQLIDKFGQDKPGSVLVCQIQAGGVGLNIQAASVVLFCEPQIKPSMETQAVARAYRMGQSQSVIVHRLLIQDSVDERVMEILHGKAELFEHFADESVIGEMNSASLESTPQEDNINETQVMTSIVEEEKKRLGVTK